MVVVAFAAGEGRRGPRRVRPVGVVRVRFCSGVRRARNGGKLSAAPAKIPGYAPIQALGGEDGRTMVLRL